MMVIFVILGLINLLATIDYARIGFYARALIYLLLTSLCFVMAALNR